MKNPTSWAISIAPIIYWIHFSFYPIITFFSWITRITYKLFRIDSISKQSNLSEEEIKLLIKISEEEGVIESEEKEMLHGVLNVFDKVVMKYDTEN